MKAGGLFRFPVCDLRSRRRRRTPPNINDPKPSSHRALTLLEVILAISLTVLLTGAVYAFYHLTLRVRDDVRQEGQVVFAQRHVVDLLAEELQSAIVYPMFMVGMQGQSDEISFMRTTVPSRAVYLAEQLLNAPPEREGSSKATRAGWEPEHDIQLVTYRLNRYEDESGVEQIGGLERTRLRTIAASVAVERSEESGPQGRAVRRVPAGGPEGGSTVHVSLLTTHVKFLYLQYWDGSAWVDSWTERSLPPAVRIELGTEPLPEETPPDEYPYETIWRIVAIPAGYTQPEGALIRMPGRRGSEGEGGGGRGR